MNHFKQAIGAGEQQIGLWQSLANPYTAEICAGAGFDWLLIDGEHAPNDIPLILSQLQAVAPYPVEPVVRMPVADRTITKQLLDIGVRSLLVPMIECAAQAEEMVRATRYPPAGDRGVGSSISRASRWNRDPDYQRNCQRDICLLLQVESIAGLKSVEAITAVDGVDGVFIGPADLAAAMGHLGDAGHPEVQDIIDRGIATIVGSGKAAGILTVDQTLARRYLAAGASFVAVGAEVSLLARAAETLARSFASNGPPPSRASAAY